MLKSLRLISILFTVILLAYSLLASKLLASLSLLLTPSQMSILIIPILLLIGLLFSSIRPKDYARCRDCRGSGLMPDSACPGCRGTGSIYTG